MKSGSSSTTGSARQQYGKKPTPSTLSSSTSAKRGAVNTSGFKHKKDDDEIDEESGASKDFMEQKYRKDNDKKLDALADSVTSIKQLSKNIGVQMEEEKTTIGQLDIGFLKTKELVNKIVGSMDTMLNQASSNIFCYIGLFTVLMITLLVKFG